MRSPRSGSWTATAVVIIAFGIAMGYLEAAVVVYLRAALGLASSVVVPVIEAGAFDELAAIEIARELATLVMIAAAGWLAGRSGLERLAWAAVVFGTWDVVYYAGLWLTIRWPGALDAWDILFLVPMPWAGPVWAPLVVSTALFGFGLAASRGLRAGHRIVVGPLRMGLALAGAALVILSFLADTDSVLAGETSPWTAWPLFWLGMGLATVAALVALDKTPHIARG